MHGALKDAGTGSTSWSSDPRRWHRLRRGPFAAGHAFFHGEKAPLPLEANVVIAVGNCGCILDPGA